jgi:hypothetical protein
VHHCHACIISAAFMVQCAASGTCTCYNPCTIVTNRARLLQKHLLTVAACDLQAGSGLSSLFQHEVDASLTWDIIPWLKSTTRLPIMVKVSTAMLVQYQQHVVACVLSCIITWQASAAFMNHQQVCRHNDASCANCAAMCRDCSPLKMHSLQLLQELMQ